MRGAGQHLLLCRRVLGDCTRAGSLSLSLPLSLTHTHSISLARALSPSHTHIHTNTHTHIHTDSLTHTYTHTHIHTYRLFLSLTHTHTHTHTHSLSLLHLSRGRRDCKDAGDLETHSIWIARVVTEREGEREKERHRQRERAHEREKEKERERERERSRERERNNEKPYRSAPSGGQLSAHAEGSELRVLGSVNARRLGGTAMSTLRRCQETKLNLPRAHPRSVSNRIRNQLR